MMDDEDDDSLYRSLHSSIQGVRREMMGAWEQHGGTKGGQTRRKGNTNKLAKHGTGAQDKDKG